MINSSERSKSMIEPLLLQPSKVAIDTVVFYFQINGRNIVQDLLSRFFFIAAIILIEDDMSNYS